MGSRTLRELLEEILDPETSFVYDEEEHALILRPVGLALWRVKKAFKARVAEEISNGEFRDALQPFLTDSEFDQFCNWYPTRQELSDEIDDLELEDILEENVAKECTGDVHNENLSGTAREKRIIIKLCSIKGCANQARSGGRVCVEHGAKVKRCSIEGCTNQDQNGGFVSSMGRR